MLSWKEKIMIKSVTVLSAEVKINPKVIEFHQFPRYSILNNHFGG